MSFNPILIKRKKDNAKPIFYCSSKWHMMDRYYIPPEHIKRCTIEGCSCHQINGWVATCNGCGRVIHNCLWGCRHGVHVLSSNRRKWTNENESICLELTFHGRTIHDGQPMTLEY